jgi:hypothetical protein
MRSHLNGKLWEELTEEEHQRMPGDYEAQISQGAVAAHSEEHLATSDRGIVMLRRYLQSQFACNAVKIPPGPVRCRDASPIAFDAENYLEGDRVSPVLLWGRP